MTEVQPNSISEKLRALIPDFPKGPDATVVYRLLQSGVTLQEVDKNGVGRPVKQQGQPTLLTAQCTIYDPFKEDDVVLMVTKGKEQKPTAGGGIILVDKIDHLKFNSVGELTVTRSQKPLYDFMELMSCNKTNRVPGAPMPSNGYLFERVEPEKTEQQLADRNRMALKVKSRLADLTDEETRLLALDLRQDASKTTDGMFNDLCLLADADPEQVFNAMGEEKLKARALVNEAAAANVVEFVGDKQQWVQSVTREVVLTTAANSDPKDALVDYLISSQGQKTKTALARLLEEKNSKKKK
jgi:hypothetical protein